MNCQEIEKKLVEYADGELAPMETAAIEDHLKTCPPCRDLLEALNRSLDLAAVIWQDGEAALAEVPAAKGTRVHHRWWWRTGMAAAGLLALLSAALLLLPRPSAPAVMTPAEKERLLAEINRAGTAAKLLASVEFLAEQEETRSLACRQFKYIVSQYPNTEAAAKAELRLKTLCERRTLQ